MMLRRHTVASRLFKLILLLLLIPQIAEGQETTPLKVGASIERELMADVSSHAYSIDLSAGQFVFGEVLQRSVDVVVTVSGPDGEILGSFDNPARGPEPFQFEAIDSGIHTIRVAPYGGETGRYVIRLKRAEQPDGSPEQRTDWLMLPHEGSDRPGGVIGVIRGGEVIFTSAYGMADLAHGVPNTPETLFNIGSVSKQFTGMAFALLAEQGVLSLDDDVRTYLPELPDFGVKVTLRHLLNHTSGYREVYGVLALEGRSVDGDILKRSDALSVVIRQPALQFEPGSEHLYNSTGYVLLAEIVERITGTFFPDWMAGNIFQPLGMTSTVIEGEWGEVIPGASTSYVLSEGGKYKEGATHYAYYGATDIYTNIFDLAKWLKNLKSGELGGPGVLDRMWERSILTGGDTLNYTLGLSFDRHQGLDRISHGGGTGGYRAFLAYYPDLDAGVAVLSNTPAVDCQSIAEQTAELFFEDEFETGSAAPEVTEPLPAEPTIEVDQATLDRFTGVYTVIRYGALITFTRAGNRLTFLQEGREEARPLRAIDEFTFVHDGSGIRITFHEEPDGTVARATLSQRGSEFAIRRGLPWKPSTEELAEYSGRYFSEEVEAFYSVTVQDGVLTMHHRHIGDIPLRTQDKDLFRGPSSFTVEFLRNEAGTITGFTVSETRMRGVLFRKLDDPHTGIIYIDSDAG